MGDIAKAPRFFIAMFRGPCWKCRGYWKLNAFGRCQRCDRDSAS